MIPLNEDDWYWLVTPWACRWLRSPHTNLTNYVWYVRTDGSCNGYNASYSCVIRPALLLNSDLLVSLDDEVEDDCCGECDCCGGKDLPSLDGISTATLLEEIQRRAMRAGSVFMGEDGTDE